MIGFSVVENGPIKRVWKNALMIVTKSKILSRFCRKIFVIVVLLYCNVIKIMTFSTVHT